MLDKFVYIFLLGFLSSLALLFFFKRFCIKLNFFNKNESVPVFGGITVFISFLLGSSLAYLFFPFGDNKIAAIIFASSIMFAFGIIDDYYELSITAKFLVQLVAASFLIFSGVRTNIVYIGPALNILITFIWILAITNAFNHLDVADAVCASVALIVAFSFFIVSFLNSQLIAAGISLALAASLSGFLIYNFPPAKVYLGNAGSHFLGFSLSAIALIISYASMEKKIALISPLLILGFPIFDTIFLIFVRLGKKKLPFKKSNDHIVLRFLALGYGKKKSLFIMVSWSAFFAFCGIIVSQAVNLFGLTVVLAAFSGSILLARRIIKVKV